MKKRVFSMLLVLAMVASMLPLAVFNVSAATLPTIPNLHRGVLENCEDTNYVYWDPVEGAERYTVKVTNGTSIDSFNLTNVNSDMNSPSGKFVIKTGNVVSGSADYYYAKAGEYKVQVTATKKYGSITQEIAFSEISITIKEKEQISQDGTANTMSVIAVESGDAVKMPVGKAPVADIGTVITQKMLEKANYELAYVEGVDWLTSSWNKDGELELTGTVPEKCPNGEYIAYVGLKHKDSNTGFIIKCTVKVSGKTYVSEIVFHTPNVIPTYWEIYDPSTTILNAQPHELTIDTATGSVTDGNWNGYIYYINDGTTSRYFDVRMQKYYNGVFNLVPPLFGMSNVHTFTEGLYRIAWYVPLKSKSSAGDTLAFAEDVKAYVGSKDFPVDEIEFVNDTYILCYKYYYVYDEKPVINSVKVNGTSVADGGTITANNGNVTIKTNYDGLSDAMKDYGCSVKQLSACYLNGEKITVAAPIPADNGDGTYTKSYTRTLNPGDELRVESWLEVRWFDGSIDRVDEHTVTVSRPSIAFDFANQNPVGSADETTGLTAKSGDTKSFTFGSTAVPSGYYVEKKATLKGLFAGLDADQTVTVKDGSAATLTHTFIKPGLYQLTETLKLYENGSTKAIATKSHVFLIEVAAADPAFVTQPHYAGQGMQMGENYVSWKLNFTPVKLIARYNLGTAARPNWKEVELDPTKSLASLPAISQKYTMYAYYGEGARDYVASDAFSAEKPAEFTPAFTKQPVGDQSLGGNPVEVTWATNFTPVKISIMQGSVKPTMEHSVLDDATATSTLLGASENNYFICAYYSDTEYVTSNKFKITELEPAFTLQPADGVSLGGAYSEATWATNFTPVKLALVKINYAQNGRPLYTFEELDVDATYCTVEPGFEEYAIRAYFNDTQYVTSNKFIVTEMNYYNAWFYVDDTVLDKVMVLEGDYVERPADPIKNGYKFIGWYTDDGEAYNFAAPVTDDVHLTARFEEVEVVYHVVKFMVDDSEWYSCAVAEGEPVSAPAVPEKDGYKFLGWSYEGAYYEFKAPVTGDMILYAEYEKIVTGHTVAFHLGTDPVGWQEVQDGDTAEKPEDPAQEGKVFLGWYTAYEGGEKFDFSTPITADLNLYARFEDAPVGGHIPGDVDGNGVVNVRDLGRLQQYLNGFDVTINEAAANVNADSNINVRDLGLLQQYLNGFDVTLK